MESKENLEVWMRGPVDSVPALLQPVAHALLQVQEEIPRHLMNFPEEKLWDKPAGLASVGFHLQHIRGVIDRLFTYARGEMLNEEQLRCLAQEGIENRDIKIESLLQGLNAQVQEAIKQLEGTDPARLTDARGIGRKQIPTTLMGLLFHAAEHSQRHTGQLLVTAAVLKAG
ncbi:DinB family protein [Arcticibacter sp. MXS-1]|uniref:DinB family protein n=1 Tax=Arcticibacter sp. MXS-1 TaxID=3341726 RepID=UPI0035A871C7